MQVTIDIPEQTYRQLEAQASAERTPLEELLLDRLRKSAGIPMQLPVKGRLGPLVERNINLNDLSSLTDDEFERLEEAVRLDPDAAVRDFGLRTLGDE